MAVTWMGGFGPNYSGGSPGGRGPSSVPFGVLDPDAKYAGDTARRGQDLQQGRFNSIFPLLSGQLNSSFGADKSNIGGLPVIDRNPIYNPAQINAQVNSQRALNDQSAQTQQRLAQQSVASRGFGSNSPLAAALQGQIGAQNMATNSEADRSIRMGAAQQNAQHKLGAQTAYEGAYVDRLKPWLSYQGQQQNALMAALSGLV